MRTSYSAIETYNSCPLKYKYQEIDKLRAPKRIEAVFGTLIHSALKFMFERGPLYPSQNEVIDFFGKRWAEKSEAIEWPKSSDKEKLEKTYYEEGIKLLKNFYAKNQPWNFNPIELESRFSLDIKDEKTNEVHTIAGIIDRMDKNPESEVYEIIDYKTGKKMPSQEMLDENLQLGLYKMAIFARWPHLKPNQVITSLYFLKHNEKITADTSKNKSEEIKKKILTAIREIEKNKVTGNFPAIPGPLCDWCGFKKICPMWSHEYKKDVIETPDDKTAAEAIREYSEIKEQEDKGDKRLKELRAIILSYMDSKKISRVFGGDTYITKTIQERVSYNFDELKELLIKEGIWDKVLEPETKKLIELLPSLPDDVQEKISVAEEKKSVITLKQSKK